MKRAVTILILAMVLVACVPTRKAPDAGLIGKPAINLPMRGGNR